MQDKKLFSFDMALTPRINYFVYRKCTPEWNLKEHFVDDYDITYIVRGRAKYTINGIEHGLGEGDLVCLSHGDKKKAITYRDSLMHCFSVNFTPQDPTGNAIALPLPAISRIGVQKDLVRLYNEMHQAWLDHKALSPLKIQAYLLLILHRLYELTGSAHETDASDYRVKKIIRYIASHYPDKITVGKMASLVELNPVYLGALFQKETGESLNRHLVKTRVRNAEYLLRSGECNVGEAACNCGFSDVAHFYKHFKAIAGVSPSQFMPKRGG
jgi:YesN/AraC family two-component response regulator